MRKRAKLEAISLFYPAYNEAGNIEEAVEQALLVLPKIARKFEIIVVNDGSKDMTLAISKRLARKYRQVKVATQRNKGYGGALKLGFKKASYDWVFYSDADLQFDLAELKRFIRYTNKYPAVIGYRKERAEGWKRQVLASSLRLWNRLLLGFPMSIRDIDCGFKLIHKSVLNEIIPLHSNGAMISTELLLKTYWAGFDIKQLGVTHYQRRIGNPTGDNLGVIIKAIADTFILQKQLFKNSNVYHFAKAQKRYWGGLSLRLGFN